jgi:sugar phosphate isomerase/epimerase
MLGLHVDEVELLFFESKKEGSLPSREEIDRLSRLSEEFSLTYNVHLPTDISPAAPGRAERADATDALKRVVDLTQRLYPTSFTLHLPFDAPGREPREVERWQGRALSGLEELLAEGVPPRSLAIENIDYPFGWVADIVRDFDLSICMDMGHLLVGGEDITAFYRENADRIAIIHLHGVQNRKDHLPLTVLSKDDGLSIVEILNGFSETLSLEVFSYDHLAASMEWLEKIHR